MRHTVLAVSLLLIGALPVAARAAEPPASDTPTDQAIDRALVFLKAMQDRGDGSWRTHGQKNVAVTALAVMAFLSAGHVPGEGPYGQTVEKGVRWILREQKPNGLIASNGAHEMYHHGIATLMLAEVAGMTSGPLGKEVRRKLEKAVAIILKAQRGGGGQERGGWRYSVAHIGGSDLSVTGWQVMALRAAKNLGCDVPADAIDRAVDYIKRSQDLHTGGFRYMPSSHLTVPCTGTGILALELCGKDLHRSPEALRAGAFLIRRENLPHYGQGYFFYSIYYGSQATFQLGGNYWATYRPHLQQMLLRHQQPNGSWTAGGSDGAYGPSYGTAMAVLALTVEYRFLPIYQRGEEPTDVER